MSNTAIGCLNIHGCQSSSKSIKCLRLSFKGVVICSTMREGLSILELVKLYRSQLWRSPGSWQGWLGFSMMRWEGGWGRCGGRAGVKDSLRAVTRGPPSPLSRTSPTPKAGPGRQAAAILNGLSQNRPIYLKFFLNLSQILSTLLQNPMCSAQAKQRLHKSFTKRDERSKESYKTCVDCSKHCLLQLSSC